MFPEFKIEMTIFVVLQPIIIQNIITMRRSVLILSAICALVFCSCKGNINDKGFEVVKVTTSDGVDYQLFADPENGVGLADAQGDILIRGQFTNLQHIKRGTEGDCLIASIYTSVKYSEEERKSTGYYIESRPVNLTGVYDFEGDEILPVEFGKVEAYPNNVFLATSTPAVSGKTVDMLFKGTECIATYDDIEVSDKGTAALGISHHSQSGFSFRYFINPLTNQAYELGRTTSCVLGDNCVVFHNWGGDEDYVMGLDGEILLPVGVYDSVKLADGDYLICDTWNEGMAVFHVSDTVTPLLKSGKYEEYLKIPGAPGLFLFREESPETRSKSWTFDWRYGLVDANGTVLIPTMYADAEIKSDIIKFRIPGTWKYDELSISMLASKHAIEK